MSEQYLTVNHLPTKDIARIFSKIFVNQITGCWEWTGYCRPEGYGQLYFDGRIHYLHRLMYAWLVQPIPKGKGKNVAQIDHLCNVRHCCNPIHLKLTSPRENTLRSNSPVARNSRKTHCPKGHAYTEKSHYISKGVHGRVCHQCHAHRESVRRNDPAVRDYNQQKAKEWRAANPERVKEQRRLYRLKKRIRP